MNLEHLTTEGQNPNSETLDCLTSLEFVRLMNAEDDRVAEAVGKIAASLADAIDVISARLADGGRLIYIGAGTSGRLGVLDASECPPTFNSPPWQVVGVIAGGTTALTRAVEGAEDHPELAVTDLKEIDLSSRDVLVGIATSGRTPYVIGGLEHGKAVGAYTIALTCNEHADISRVADLTLAPIVGPEIISGSTRLKAGTATKLVLNMLSTGAMIKQGKVYGNLMVDLQTTNLKLVDRCGRIVTTLTGLPRDQADALLKRCGGDVKASVVVHQRGVSPTTARQLLEKTQGGLRDALKVDNITHSQASSAVDRRPVFGVDGGGSKTLAWLIDPTADSQTPIGVGESGPSNPLAVGWHTAIANIELALNRAFVDAGIPHQEVAAACLAIAGTGRDVERQRLELWAEQHGIAERMLVTNDAHPILAAGTSTGVGVAIISGTGSFAFGQNPQGKTARAGGWGQVFGDDGSGHAIARAGLRAVARAHDGTGPATRLTSDLLQAFNAASFIDLREAVSADSTDVKKLARLAPLVMTAAGVGDSVACEIVEDAARGLSGLVLSVHRQLRDHPDSFPIELALSGGMLSHSEFFREKVLENVAQAGLSVARQEVVAQPVQGAVTLARRLLTPCSTTPESS